MTDITRISPEKTKELLDLGKALLVCAYDNDEKFAQYHLEGALSLSQLQSKEAELLADQEIIFYCN